MQHRQHIPRESLICIESMTVTRWALRRLQLAMCARIRHQNAFRLLRYLNYGSWTAIAASYIQLRSNVRLGNSRTSAIVTGTYL